MELQPLPDLPPKNADDVCAELIRHAKSILTNRSSIGMNVRLGKLMEASYVAAQEIDDLIQQNQANNWRLAIEAILRQTTFCEWVEYGVPATRKTKATKRIQTIRELTYHNGNTDRTLSWQYLLEDTADYTACTLDNTTTQLKRSLTQYSEVHLLPAAFRLLYKQAIDMQPINSVDAEVPQNAA